VLLNNNYGSVVLGQPLAAASLLNRLQSLSTIPLLNTADFEAGAGFRIQGATVFPRAMAVGAAGDEMLAFEAARITALEARAMGVHVNFAPIADVNNNARNPVINTRAFGEVPEAVGRLASAYVRGLHAGGMLATLKHFPGHGDTDVDSHLGLPIINHPRERLEKVELAPFGAGMAAGADAVMTAHIQLPALDPAEFSPATLSPAIVTGLLRGQLKFDGLVYTDSMGMDAISRRIPPGEAAARAIKAGNDVVLHSPDDEAAVAGIKAAVEKGEIPQAQLDGSVRRILTAKARLGLYKAKLVPLDELPKIVGGRAHAAVAQELGKRSITLVKDDRNQVPLRAPREASVLYL
jgi:beta-N-acetylhexosaminidase